MTDGGVENFSILIIDDDLQFGRLVQRLFQQMNRSVDIALSGTEAIAKVKDCSTLIVYLDVNLPDLPSLAVAEAIRNQSGLSVIIIGLSGHERSEVSEFVNSPFVDLYEQKPMSLGDLKTLLQATMNQAADLLKNRIGAT